MKAVGTPTGCYALDAKESPAVLTGEDYEANVTYWMPFAGNVGIHDASWRSEFGGNLYLWEGSHGCVNVPYDKRPRFMQILRLACRWLCMSNYSVENIPRGVLGKLESV